MCSSLCVGLFCIGLFHGALGPRRAEALPSAIDPIRRTARRVFRRGASGGPRLGLLRTRQALRPCGRPPRRHRPGHRIATHDLDRADPRQVIGQRRRQAGDHGAAAEQHHPAENAAREAPEPPGTARHIVVVDIRQIVPSPAHLSSRPRRAAPA